MSKRVGAVGLAISLLILLASCGQNMRDQAKCVPYEVSTFFANGSCAQQIPENAVARGSVQNEPEQAGLGPDGKPAADFPFPITREVLSVGQRRYNVFCVPCHGISGHGNGMIVQRGFPAPPSFHTQRLRDAPPGYFVNVITNGFGRMYSYAFRVEPDDRWAIAAYIRALQLSQNATLDDVPPEERPRLQGTTP